MEWYLNLRGSSTYQAGVFGWVFLLGLSTCHYGIDSTRNYGVILKFERFFYLSG